MAPDPLHPHRTALGWVPYLYLVRVQFITMGVLVLGPFLAVSSPLLNGLFDLSYGDSARSVASMALVSLAAFSTAWTLLASSVTTLVNAPLRFGTEPVPFIRFPIRWPEREAFGLMALAPIGVAAWHSWHASAVSVVALAAGAVIGAALAIALLLWANKTAAHLQRCVCDPASHRFIVRMLRRLVQLVDRPNVRDGFIDPLTGHLRPGHMVAWVVFFTSIVLYLIIGLVGRHWVGYVPTLACALLLALMLCWFFAGLAFFFDRYRTPVLAIAVALLLVVGRLPIPGQDHTYDTMAQDPGTSPFAHEVFRVGATTPIIIAAPGGGIQAAAWTARVLTGIGEALPEPMRASFTHSIRMISSVSGGGVGAMYFAQLYSQGSFDDVHLHQVLEKAEASSLEDVAWGAVYPDLLANVFPPVRRYLGDRGDALERAWIRQGGSGADGVAGRLGDWRDQVWSDMRPANIFNATMVDTGERLLMGTTRVGWRPEEGLHNYEDVYRTHDLPVVTAARLAASFTYVSPASRPDIRGDAYHVVDGGYYDDYGMTTLTEWLDEGLEGMGLPKDGGVIRRVLVLQIRAAPPEQNDHPDSGQGYFYQVAAPIETMLNVRTTGQLSHDDEEFARLQRLWQERGIEIDNVVFGFCGEHPPLSWHLTGGEKAEIERAWRDELDGPRLKAVRGFLTGAPIAGADADKPFDAPLAVCTPVNAAPSP